MPYLYDRRGSAAPLPDRFSPDEIGLMTLKEFLSLRNPNDKYHRSDAYDFDIVNLNRDRGIAVGSIAYRSNERISAYRYPRGYKLTADDRTIAVIHGGVAYYEDPRWARRLPEKVYKDPRGDSAFELPFTRTRQVKYLSELMPEISPTAKLNEEEYPVVLQRLIVGGEPLTLRAEAPPQRNKGVNLAVLNSDGYVVATAQNEWGATLLTVAREYRGKGLGKLVGKYWYDQNPSWNSGGFTPQGERNAIELWKDRVREFLSNGWYSELVRQKRMTPAQVNAILKDVGKRFKRESPAVKTKLQATGDLLVHCDDGISFVLYDRAYLQEQDDRFILGFGFLRDSDPVGTFVYRLEYERAHAVLATKIILQMARDNGDTLFDGEGYHDMLENVDAIPGVERNGDYLEVTRDLVPLKQWARLEKAVRGKVDRYGEIYNSLIEQAESKWS